MLVAGDGRIDLGAVLRVFLELQMPLELVSGRASQNDCQQFIFWLVIKL